MPPVTLTNVSARDQPSPGDDRASARAAVQELQPFRLGSWCVEPALGVVRRGNTVRHLEPKMVDVLIELARQPGKVVSKDAILDAVWPDVTVGHHAFWRCISGLRKALGDDAREPCFIETIPHRGYRLIAPLATVQTATARPIALPTTLQPHVARGAARWRTKAGMLAAVILGIGALLAGTLVWFFAQPPHAPITIVVAPLALAAPTTSPRPVPRTGGDTAAKAEAAAMTEALRIAIGALPGVELIRYQTDHGDTHHRTAYRHTAYRLTAYRLTGTLRTTAGRVVLALRLHQPEGGRQVWAARLVRGIDEEPGIDDHLERERDLAQAAAAEIAARLPTATDSAFLRHPRADRDAHSLVDHLVRRGRALWARRGGDDLRAARDTFRAALDLDPSHARAWAGLADAESLLARHAAEPSTRRFANARAAAERALRLDPTLAAAHASIGFVALNQDWDFATAESAYRHALALDPHHAAARQWRAELLAFRGRYDEALVEIETAWRANPESPIIQAIWGRLLGVAGYHQAAYRRLRSTLAAGAPLTWLYNDLATVSARLGRGEESAAWRLRWLAAAGAPPEDLVTLKNAIATRGIQAFWHYLLDHGGGAASRAAAHAALGDHQQALAALSEAARGRGENVLHLAFDPAFDSLRGHSRFAVLTGGVSAHLAAASRHHGPPWARPISKIPCLACQREPNRLLVPIP